MNLSISDLGAITGIVATISSAVCSLFYLFVNLTVRNTVQSAMNQLHDVLSQRYVSRELFDTYKLYMQGAIGELTGRIDSSEKYCHENNHDVRNEITYDRLKIVELRVKAGMPID